MTKRVEKLLAIPNPEKIKETELIDTPTVLPYVGCSSTCKLVLKILSFLTSLIIMVVGTHLNNLKKQHMISSLQRKESKRNSLTESYIHSSYFRLGHFTRWYDLYSDLLRSSLRRKHGITTINVQLCSRDGAFLLDLYDQKRSVPW